MTCHDPGLLWYPLHQFVVGLRGLKHFTFLPFCCEYSCYDQLQPGHRAQLLLSCLLFECFNMVHRPALAGSIYTDPAP